LRKDKLPASIIQGKKTGFDIPAHEWLRGPLRAMLVDTLQEGLTEYRDLFHGEVVEGFLKAHFDRQTNAGYHLWGLMILFQWMKKWRIQAASSTAPKTLLQARAGAST
jgi:asparagine synthase (glutamine-hydrolysing)